MADCDKCGKQLSPKGEENCEHCGAPVLVPGAPSKTILGFAPAVGGRPVIPPLTHPPQLASPRATPGPVTSAVTPKSVTPKSVTPKSVTPKSVTPKSVTPKPVTPKPVDIARAVMPGQAPDSGVAQAPRPVKPMAEERPTVIAPPPVVEAAQGGAPPRQQVVHLDGAPATSDARPTVMAPGSGPPQGQQVVHLDGVPATSDARPTVMGAAPPVAAALPPPPSDPGLSSLPQTDPDNPDFKPALQEQPTVVGEEGDSEADKRTILGFAEQPGTPAPGAAQPPQAATVIEAPQAATVLEAPQAATVIEAPQAATVLEAPQAATVLEAPQAATVLEAPQAQPVAAAQPVPVLEPEPASRAPQPTPPALAPAGEVAVAGGDLAPGAPSAIDAGGPIEPLSSQWELGAGVPQSSPIPELTLLEDERLIAIERPGAFFWILFGILCLLIITLPLALWMLFKSTGKLYAVTNKRAIRVSRTGTVTYLMHEDLESTELAGFLGAAQVSLLLRPKPECGAKALSFGLCGPTGGMSRLWGVINFWVLSDAVSVEQAPQVDASGALADESHGLDVAIFDRSRYHKGLDLSQAQRTGVTVLTPNRLIWARSEDVGSGGKVHATIPVFAFIHAAARSCRTVEAFEEEIERVAKTGAMAEVMSRGWDKVTAPKHSAARGLRYLDAKDGKKVAIHIPGRHRQQVSDYLGKLGIVEG